MPARIAYWPKTSEGVIRCHLQSEEVSRGNCKLAHWSALISARSMTPSAAKGQGNPGYFYRFYQRVKRWPHWSLKKRRFLRLPVRGSSTLNRGHEHQRLIKRCNARDGRPRCFGGTQRGSGT